MTRAPVILLAVAVIACGQAAVQSDITAAGPPPGGSLPSSPVPSMPSTDVRIVLDRTTYAARDQVRLTITNNGPRNLGYNACTRIIERDDGSQWRAVPEPDRVCTMELRLLGRGETVSEQTDLPILASGRYRIALSFSDESASAGAPVRGVSDPFSVR